MSDKIKQVQLDKLYDIEPAVSSTLQVDNAAPTLAWNTTSVVGTVDGVDLTVKLPANPNTGTVTSVRVQATNPVVSSSNTAQTSTLNTTISLADGYGDTKNPYASKTANYVLAAPNGSAGAPTFRALAAADIPSLAASKITSGTLAAARLPAATSDALGGVKTSTGITNSSGTISVTYGTTAGTACQGNDSRLSDSRTPTPHNQASSTINNMTGYSKPSSTSAITTADTLNAAIGKLEKALDGKQASGSYLTSHQTIKQDGITGATVNRFGTCSTAAATVAKTVSVTQGTFSLETGARVSVKFSNANTASTPTLNVNSKGAKNIYYRGTQITTGSSKELLAGVCDFVYDGTQWHLVGTANTLTYDSTNKTLTIS